MGKVRRSTLVGLTLLLMGVAGCKVSCTTANISSLKFSKDEKGTIQTKEFAPNDTVYAIATVSNNAGKVTLKFSLIAEKVQGLPENAPQPKLDMSTDVQGSGSQSYYVTPPSSGWPAGRYRIEVVMLYAGDQKDKKSDTFTVTGGGGATLGSPATGSPPGKATPAEEDENQSDNSSPHGER